MIDDVIKGLYTILEWQNLLAIVGGVYLGVIIGMLPGLSPSMAVALATPFTLFMPAVAGLSLLLGIYKGGVYGGSVSAILIGTPGTPEAAATVYDGYTLANQGKAGKALYAALYASICGDMMGILVLICFSPFIAKFALAIGPAETVPLIIVALSIIIVSTGEEKVKGFIAATIGFFLSTIGTDPMLGSTRLAFGSLELSDGISLIPLLIGLFAIPEIITQIINKDDVVKRKVSQTLDDSTMSIREFFSHWKVFLRSSLIGSFIGAMPGLGASVAAFTCYAVAQKGSKQPELYGKGSVEGLIACETGNNGTVGPALIPLLTLGIPGSATAAVLYGSLIINGIVPGPFIFRDHGPIVYALFIGLIIGGVLLYPIAISIFKYSIEYFYKVEKRYIFSAVFLLCISGSYAIASSMTDVYVMCITGIVAYQLTSFGFRMGPVLIAFILGPILERAGRESLILSGNNVGEIIYSSYISIFLWLLILWLVLYLGIIKKVLKKRKEANVSN